MHTPPPKTQSHASRVLTFQTRIARLNFRAPFRARTHTYTDTHTRAHLAQHFFTVSQHSRLLRVALEECELRTFYPPGNAQHRADGHENARRLYDVRHRLPSKHSSSRSSCCWSLDRMVARNESRGDLRSAGNGRRRRRAIDRFTALFHFSRRFTQYTRCSETKRNEILLLAALS